MTPESPVKDKLQEATFYFNQGEAQRIAGNFDVAISCHEESVKVGHPFFKARSLLALLGLYRQTGQHDKEMETLQRVSALPVEERGFIPLSSYAVVMQRLGKFDEARKSYEDALRLKPGDPSLILNYAELNVSLGRYDEATKLLASIQAAADRGDRKITIMSRFFYLLLAVLQHNENEVTRYLSMFVEAIRTFGLPADLHWDFTDIEATLRRVTEPNGAEILAKIRKLLQREVDPQDFLREFSAVSLQQP